jgi:cell division transport system ATP-binding protein
VYKLRRQLGVVFQDYKLIPDKNAYENVAFAMEVAGKKEVRSKRLYPYVLDIVGLTSRMDASPQQLSGGEKQRVAIARAIRTIKSINS